LVYFRSQHKSVEERILAGKALRKKLPRIEMGDYKPSAKLAAAAKSGRIKVAGAE
jgi:hypothetical protein